jgi:hypothetical protein
MLMIMALPLAVAAGGHPPLSVGRGATQPRSTTGQASLRSATANAAGRSSSGLLRFAAFPHGWVFHRPPPKEDPMPANTTTAPSTAAATDKQLQTIADLTAELGYTDVPEPRSAAHASAIIRRLIEDRTSQGDAPAPTSAQVRLLEKLGAERGKDYKIPATRKQASAKIQQLLAAAKPAEPEVAAA